MATLTAQQKKDIRLIGKFVAVYCGGKHATGEKTPVNLPDDVAVHKLCPECTAFIEYAVAKRLKCPLGAEKPSCKHCRIHCYDSARREKVRQIMAYSGRKLLLRGRFDYLWHYFF